MNRTMQRIFVGLVIVLLVGLATAGTRNLERTPNPESDDRSPASRPFKINAVGHKTASPLKIQVPKISKTAEGPFD